jgi:methionyl-tRNA formyltransferase
MNTVFVGAVEGSHRALHAICSAGHVPRLVVTLPLALAHRHSDYADLAPLAAEYGVPVHLTSDSNAPQTLAAIAATAPDLILVIGWSQIVQQAFRALPRLGSLGFHPADLPRLRGRAVIPWAILLGEREVGSTLFWIDEGTDTGAIAAKTRFTIDPDTVTARELYDRHLEALAGMLPALLTRIAADDLPRVPQDEAGASLCARRRPEDGRIDWSRPAAEIHRLIRAVGPPYPGAFTEIAGGNRLVLTAVRFPSREGYYIGLPGQVQAIEGRNFTVSCGDRRCVDILGWTGADGPPRLHTILGKGTA